MDSDQKDSVRKRLCASVASGFCAPPGEESNNVNRPDRHGKFKGVLFSWKSRSGKRRRIQFANMKTALPAVLGFLLLAAPATNAQFNFTTNAGSVTITGYTGLDGVVNIPPSLGGLPVTAIGDDAFQFSPSLTSITIPDTVTTIGDAVFNDCVNLAGVTIPDSVTSMGMDVFNDCTSLTAATIGNGVTSIGAGAFMGCTSLASVTLGSGLTSIGDSAFDHCLNLSSVTIPGGVTSIGAGAFFYCAGLANITISASVTTLGDQAFQDCFNLTSVYFESNAPAADSSVFASDNNATLYYLPGATGWTTLFAGRPTAIWETLVRIDAAGLGVQSNEFGFNIIGANNAVVVVEATANLANPVWSSIATITLTNGPFHFSEPVQINSPSRFYRLSPP